MHPLAFLKIKYCISSTQDGSQHIDVCLIRGSLSFRGSGVWSWDLEVNLPRATSVAVESRGLGEAAPAGRGASHLAGWEVVKWLQGS